MIESDKPVTPLMVSLHVKKHNDQPAVELRRVIMRDELLKALVTAAIHERPVIIQPVFKDKLQAVGSLCDLGVLYREDGEFYFTI
jgi:hypothetical protein